MDKDTRIVPRECFCLSTHPWMVFLVLEEAEYHTKAMPATYSRATPPSYKVCASISRKRPITSLAPNAPVLTSVFFPLSYREDTSPKECITKNT